MKIGIDEDGFGPILGDVVALAALQPHADGFGQIVFTNLDQVILAQCSTPHFYPAAWEMGHIGHIGPMGPM